MNLWYVRLLLVLLAALQLVMPPVAHGQSAARLEVTVPSRLGFQGESISPLQRPVTLNAVDMTLGEVLSEISSQASLGLIYGSDLVPLSRRITIQLDSLPATMALRRVLAGTNMDFNAVSEKQVVLVRRPPASAARAAQKNGVITGRVTEKGTENPVVGAQVLVDGVGRAITNPEGRYQITGVKPGKHTVSVVMIGYRGGTQEVEVGDGATVVVNFTLEAAPTQLSELVVTATGEERRRVELGNDIVVINADSIVKREPITSVTDLLEGRVPGLIVQRTSGAPGDPARIRLRGVSSPRGSNDPIVVVDGIRVAGPDSGERGANLATRDYAAPSPLDYIDPHTIETIQVLKGPSAATIYGQDAANGVIVITTKKGVAGQARWTASVEHGRSRISGEFPELYVRWGRLPSDNQRVICPVNGFVNGQGISCQPDDLVTQQLLNDPSHTVLDEGHRTAMSIGVSGGNAGVTYSVNASYRDEVGLPRLPDYEAEYFQTQYGQVVPEWMRRPQAFKQWSVSSRLQTDLGGSATVSLTSNLSRTEQQRSSIEGELGRLMATYVDPTTGTYYESVGGFGHALIFPRDGRLIENYARRVTAEATQFTNAVNLKWRAKRWLTVTADAGINTVWRADETLAPFGTASQPQGDLTVGQGTSVVGTARVNANSEVPLGLGFRLRMAAGVSYTGTATDDIRTGVVLGEGRNSLSGADSLKSVSGQAVDDATFGWYIEPGIAHRRMWLNIGLRFDGGSRYGADVKGFKLPSFPKLSYSYLISDEPYFPDALRAIFDQLRLRVAYGHAGRQPGAADRLRLYSAPVQAWIGTGEARTILLKKLGNEELNPERSREFEGGFDADLLDNRVSVSFTAYQQTTEDAILDVPIAPSVYGDNVSRLQNIGVTRNTGLELGLSVEPVRTDLVTWRAQFQVSRNRNVVVELGPGVEPFYTSGNSDGGIRVAAGYPLFGRWIKPVLGYTDSNGDGVLDPAEVIYGDTAVYVGATLPEYTASLHSTVSLFRGVLSVSAGLLYEDGMTQENAARRSLRAFSRGWNDPSSSLVEQLSSFDVTGYTTIQTVNSLRLNSVSVSYMVPTNVSRWFGADALTVSLQGTNLGLWTNYSGLDPNVNGRATGNNVVDTGVIPTPRTWQIRVNATY